LVFIALLCGTFAYALLQTQHQIAHDLSIKGVGVYIWTWIDDVTPPTELKTTHDWDKMAGGQQGVTGFLLVENYGTENLILTFTDDLDVTFGVVEFLIEWYDISLPGWKVVNWQDEIDSGTPYKDDSYIPGTPQNPLEPGQMIGYRPESPVDKDIGHIWIRLTVDDNAPMGQSTSFTTSVIGTEYTG